jgi:hypothetical protein
MATTPMTAISSMSAPVKARPLEVVGVVDVAPSVAAVVLPAVGLPDVVFPAVVLMPVDGVVHPV